jgi:hypothetical protein
MSTQIITEPLALPNNTRNSICVFYHGDGVGKFPGTLQSTYETMSIHVVTFHKEAILRIPRFLSVTPNNYIVQGLHKCLCPQYLNFCV